MHDVKGFPGLQYPTRLEELTLTRVVIGVLLGGYLPSRADTDGDGLNDSEDVNLGSDGSQTDLWKTDTDGDGLGNNEYFEKGTSPVLADTDRDGVRDDRDVAPLGDLFVEVSINSITVRGSDPHNSGMPYPFVRASILGNDTYTPYIGYSSGSWVTLCPYNDGGDCYYDGHRLSVNVPDDASSVDVTFQAWSYDSTGHNAHTAISLGTAGSCGEVFTVTKVFPLVPGTSTTYPLSGGCPGTSAMYASPLSVTLTTFVPDRLNAYLIVPDDYAGIHNVTDSVGNVLSRRYVGEPRFVAILLNATTWEPAFHCYCGPPIRVSFLVPR